MKRVITLDSEDFRLLMKGKPIDLVIDGTLTGIVLDECVDVADIIKGDDMSSFKERLEALLNSNSMEEGSNTPDFVLAEFLSTCLRAFNEATVRRDTWYNVKLKPARIAKDKWREVASALWFQDEMEDMKMNSRLVTKIALLLEDEYEKEKR
jgi:hypothetical protein